MGAPSDYTPELTDAICARMAAGETLKAICDDKAMPVRSSVYLWLVKHPEFKTKYDDARKVQWETWADELVAIADTPQMGTVTIDKGDKGMEVRTGDMVEHRRLRSHNRMWLLARLDPNRFGDRVKQEHTGADGTPLIPVINLTVGTGRPTAED